MKNDEGEIVAWKDFSLCTVSLKSKGIRQSENVVFNSLDGTRRVLS